MEEKYFKIVEVIGLLPLMLRWPVMCFTKIAHCNIHLANREEFSKGGGTVAPLSILTLYQVKKVFEHQTNTLIVF